MKDTILNVIVIGAAFSAILMSAVGNIGSAPQTVVASASRVVEMQKTVVAAKRLPANTALVASIDQ